MRDSDILGMHFPATKKFYYFENGQHTPGQTGIDRLRTVLMSRGVLDLTDANKKHQVMTLAVARNEGCEIEVIYLNNHIKKQVQAEDKKHDLGTLWD